MESNTGKRLQVFMAACGVGSRRACEQLIEDGRVAVNGETVARQGVKIDPAVDTVTLDGKRLREVHDKLYLALNKPAGYICTNHDPQARPLAISLLGPVGKRNRLFSVGRLDLMSSGLILYTNDGEFARAVAHPSTGVEKEYLVETRKPIAPAILEEFVSGIIANGVRYRIVRYRAKSATTVRIVLREGKNRELRNIFAARRIQVKKIHRVRIGTVSVGDLAPGAFRHLAKKEVAALLNAAHSPTPSREKQDRRNTTPRRAAGPPRKQRSTRPADEKRGT